MTPTPLTPTEITNLATAGKAYPIGGPWEPWCVAADMQNAPQVESGVLPYTRDNAIDWASQILYELTGRIFPGRAKDYVTVYPSRGDRCTPFECYCSCVIPPASVRMNYRYPIVDVYEIRDNTNAIIDPSLWDFVGPNILVRTDALVWSCCGITALAAVGAMPTTLARRAAAELASALERVDVEENTCLPRGIKSITTATGTLDLQPIRDDLATGKYSRMPFVSQLLNLYPRDKGKFVDVWSLDLEPVSSD